MVAAMPRSAARRTPGPHDPELIHRTGGDPGAGPSNAAAPAAPPQQPPAPHQDRWVRPPSPLPERVAERLRESETEQPLRPMRYCPLHGWGSCPVRQPWAPPTDADTTAPAVQSSGLLVQVASPARPRARTRLTARKSTGPRGRPVGQIASTSTATVAVEAISSSSDDERIALVLGNGVQQRLPTPTPDDGPSGTTSPPALLSPRGNRVVRRLAHHLSPMATCAGVVVYNRKTVRRRRTRALALPASSSSLICGLARPRRARPCAVAPLARPQPVARLLRAQPGPGRRRGGSPATAARRALARPARWRGLSPWHALCARGPAPAGGAAARPPQQRAAQRSARTAPACTARCELGPWPLWIGFPCARGRRAHGRFRRGAMVEATGGGLGGG
jgi:hypothetical protein